MSFQETRSELSVCNKALARIMQQSLSGSLGDAANQSKLAGRECSRWYKSTVRWLLEKHHWNLATKRVALTEITNTRTTEWAAAYQKPSDLAFPVMVSPYTSGSGLSYYQGVGYLLGALYGRPIFRMERDAIYAFTTGAELDYVSFDITEQDFNEEFENLVVTFLASRLAEPVAKDADRASALWSEGLSAMNLAIANNLNVNRQRYDTFISDAEMARGSGLSEHLRMGWRNDPVSGW